MQPKELPQAERFAAQKHRRRIWQRVVTGLACVVVFCTVYALILPAITLEPEPVCGLQEHVHDESCYTDVPAVYANQLDCMTASLIHQHTDSCYNATGDLICGQADYVIHYHDAACYDAAGNLVCPLPVVAEHTHTEACYSQPEGHVHTETCYELSETLVCGLEESEGHVHDESCLDENGALVCGLEEQPEHIHGPECYETTEVLICGQEESEAAEAELICQLAEIVPHIHEAACYDAAGNLICGRLETRVHQHSESCMTQVEVSPAQHILTCGLPEHVHTDSCYPAQEPEADPIVEEKPAEDAPLTDAPVYCGKEAHTHTEDCYWYGQLACELEEHVHTEECYIAPVAPDADPNAGLETRADWERTLEDVTLTGEYRQDVLAIAESQLGYTACAENYIIDESGQEKRISRYGQWYGDPYGDWCAMFVSFCLHYADVEEMPLDANCQNWIETLSDPAYGLYHEAGPYARKTQDAGPEDPDTVLPAYDPQPGDLVFLDYNADGTADHVGLVTGLTAATETEAARLETIERAPGDQVQSRSYALPYGAIAGFAGLPEQTFYCGQSGHAHTEACYAGGQLVCGQEEHIHTEECESPEILEALQNTLTYTGDGYTVSVTYGPDAALPEGVELTAREILPGTAEYETYYAQSRDALAEANPAGAGTMTFARFFDVQFLVDGIVVEPAAPVSVTITYTETLDTHSANGAWAVHFAEDGTEILDVETGTPEDGGTSFTHTQNGFSVVGDVVTTSLNGTNETDKGPDALTVDYYVCIDGQWTCVGTTKTGWYGDYSQPTVWLDTNRDYITVAQAQSILGEYGFDSEADNPAVTVAYQQKSGDVRLYCDTNTVKLNSQRIVPLARNADHPGYNLYFLPANTASFAAYESAGLLDAVNNGFHTVRVFDAAGTLLYSKPVLHGGTFTYDATETGVTSWLAAYDSGGTATVSTADGILTIADIPSAVTVSPQSDAEAGSHSVTFKVLVDGSWKTVGSLPYYYTGNVSNYTRAYITSAMAAQFFGDYGYTATTEPGYQFGYSYNDIYNIIFVKDGTETDFCMDVAGANYAEGAKIQLYTNNGSPAQLFRIRKAEQNGGEDGYRYITPYKNSSLQVNLSGTGEANGQKIVLWYSPSIHSSWKVISNGNGLVSFQLKENASFYIDVNGNSPSSELQLQIWENAGARYWKLEQQFRISNDIVSEQNMDGTWNIGLTAESNGDIVCYYLPGVTETFADLTEEEAAGKATAGGTWSVTVRDDTHSVYSEGELSRMTQQVLNGGETTVTVKNAEGILWSCMGLNGETLDVERTETAEETTFKISNITQPVEVLATRNDPTYTVQYYAWMDMAADSGYKALNVIDTSGRNLPGNYSSWVSSKAQTAPSPAALKQIYLTENGTLATTETLLEVYASKKYEYVHAPDPAYVNNLAENSHYTLQELWVLKSGCDPASTDQADWTVYAPDTVSFVNRAPETDTEVLITDDTVIRFVYDETDGTYSNAANFYDYDITDGSRINGYDDANNIDYVRTNTNYYGINSDANYSGSGAKLAFGNRNAGVKSLQDVLWGQNYLNHLNASLKDPDPGYGVNMEQLRGYQGCTFGLVTSLKSDGTIQYASGVVAPKLFNESGAVTGKTSFDNGQYSLEFNRTGDTYTLSAVSGTNAVNLDQFNHALGSNNFWPMDAAPTWGADGHDLKFGSESLQYARRFDTSYYSSLPVSDDKQDHNSYFGMQYAVNFNLTEEYVGPLEYYFYGDDDMWVFLDGTLVCDIGGVHSTVGEYVNLWDYIEKGDAGSHTLSFFYTERGASGSTCYMRFTLPSVSNATLSQSHGDLQISKNVTAQGFEDVSYQFQVDLLTQKDGEAIRQTCRYMVTDENGSTTYGTVNSGGIISLKPGQTATLNGIPAGTYYQVTELTHEGYKTTVNNSEGYIIAGVIANGQIQTAAFVNTPYHELPESGGPGTYWYTVSGIAVLLLAAGLMYKKLHRRKEDHTS